MSRGEIIFYLVIAAFLVLIALGVTIGCVYFGRKSKPIPNAEDVSADTDTEQEHTLLEELEHD